MSCRELAAELFLLREIVTYLVLGQIIRQVGHHDLGLGRDTILRRTTLLLLDTATRLALLGGSSVVGLVIGQRINLSRDIGGGLGFLSLLTTLVYFCISISGGRGTYRAATTSNATPTTAATATATTPTAGPFAAFALTATCSTLPGLRGLRLASQLDRNLTLEDLITRELLDGSVGLVCGGEVHEGVTNGAIGAGVDRDGGAFTAGVRYVLKHRKDNTKAIKSEI